MPHPYVFMNPHQFTPVDPSISHSYRAPACIGRAPGVHRACIGLAPACIGRANRDYNDGAGWSNSKLPRLTYWIGAEPISKGHKDGQMLHSGANEGWSTVAFWEIYRL